MVKNPPGKEMWVLSLGWEDPLEEGNGNPLQCSCLENPHRQRSLAGYSSWSCKESDMTEATQHSIMTGICQYMDRGVLGVAKSQT